MIDFRIEESKRVRGLLVAMAATMKPGGTFREDSPRLVALMVPRREQVEVPEFFRILFGAHEAVPPRHVNEALCHRLEVAEDASKPLVVVHADELQKLTQEQLVAFKSSKRLPPTVLVTEVDPGILMLDKHWTADFRFAAHRTFVWPRIQERGFRDLTTIFDAILAHRCLTAAKNAHDALKSLGITRFRGALDVVEIANAACYVAHEDRRMSVTAADVVTAIATKDILHPSQRIDTGGVTAGA